MSSIDLACLPPAVAESLAAGKSVAVKHGRRTVAHLEPAAPPVRRTRGHRLSMEEWAAKYAGTGPSVPGAVAAFIRERE